MSVTTPADLPKPRRSALAFALGLPIAFAFLLLILMIMQYKQVHALVSKTPGEIEIVPISQALQKEALTKVLSFLESPHSPDSLVKDTLVLSEMELNQLIRYSPAIGPNASTYRLKLKDSVVEMINVMPAAQLNGPVAWMVKLFQKEGWLNSTLTGIAEFKSGRIHLTLTHAVMNGIEAPVTNFNQDDRVNPHKMAADTATFNSALLKLSDMKIRSGELLLIR